VADDVGGGMTLTSANSFIEETGINFQDDGETIYGYITEYTFDVPAVSGHNGSDYGKVEAYNIRTGQWDQIAYKETNNGVTLSGLSAISPLLPSTKRPTVSTATTFPGAAGFGRNPL